MVEEALWHAGPLRWAAPHHSNPGQLCSQLSSLGNSSLVLLLPHACLPAAVGASLLKPSGCHDMDID